MAAILSSMNKLLVTGGAGFIGSNFVHYIVNKYPNYKIIVVDKLTYAGDKSRLSSVIDKIEFIEADICNESAMEPLVAQVDCVIHFAAESHVDRSIADPGPFLSTNIMGTELLARLSVKHKIERFHHVSTDEVFGSLELGSQERFSETTPYSPRSPYAASKASSDHIIRAYGETYGLPFTITNCSNNYGPYDSPARVIPVFIAAALADKPLPIYGSGKAIRDYLYVEDHCTAIDLAIHKGEAGETYCVGGAAQENGLKVAETILEALGKPKDLIEFVTDRPGHDMRYDIDPTYIQKKLGWKQSVSFEEGIKKTIDWYVANEPWWRDYQSRISLMRQQGFGKANQKQSDN